MNLKELIHEVWKDERIKALHLRKNEVIIIADVFKDHIFKAIINHGKLKMHELFTLEVRKIKGRRIRNPQTKEHMVTKDSHHVGVVPSKKLKKELKKLK